MVKKEKPPDRKERVVFLFENGSLHSEIQKSNPQSDYELYVAIMKACDSRHMTEKEIEAILKEYYL